MKRVRRRSSDEEHEQAEGPRPAPVFPQGLGNQATGRMLQAMRAPAERTIARRWVTDQGATRFFWEDKGDGDPDYSDLPTWLHRAREERPSKAYQVEDGVRPIRRGGGEVWYTLDQWLATYGKTLAKSGSGTTFNPFGRFATTGVNSFIPNPSLGETGTEILAQLQKDKSYRPVDTADTERHPSGFPMRVTVVGGGVLTLVDVTEFGAAYSSAPPEDVTATHDPTKAKNAALLGLAGQPTQKQVFNYRITPTALKGWHGAKRSKGQAAVMSNVSAGAAVANAGFNKDEGQGWEWLHLIAHSMGGIQGAGPQVVDNLVAGTSECNSQMIVVEEWIKATVMGSGGHAALYVGVELFDDQRHIGKHITYDVEIYNDRGEPVAVHHYAFDPLSRAQPLVFVNRVERTAAKAAYPKGAEAATTHIPRSQPTAHQSIEAVQADEPTQIIDQAMHVLKTQGPQALMAHLDTLHQAHKLERDLFSELAELLRLEDLGPMLALLRAKPFGERAIFATLRSFVIDHPELRPVVLERVLAPLYGPGGVPPKLAELCKPLSPTSV